MLTEHVLCKSNMVGRKKKGLNDNVLGLSCEQLELRSQIQFEVFGVCPDISEIVQSLNQSDRVFEGLKLIKRWKQLGKNYQKDIEGKKEFKNRPKSASTFVNEQGSNS